MNILAIDTTTNKMLVAVKKGQEIFEGLPQKTSKHLEVLLPQIDYVLDKSGLTLEDIDVFAVCVGPGSFTGIRIGISTVKGFLPVCVNAKVVAVNSLDFLAYNIKHKTNEDSSFRVVMPSTMEKFYTKAFADGKEIENRIISKTELQELLDKEKVYALADEKTNLQEFHLLEVDSGMFIEYVEHLIQIGEYGDGKVLKPVYMAVSQAEEELVRKEGLKNGI